MIIFLNCVGEKVFEIIMDKIGEIYVKGLNEGYYVLVEMKVLIGYLLDIMLYLFDVIV